MTVPLVIDTDTAQDDCVAILAALLDPVADLRAITMVAGNVAFEQQVKNAFMTLNVLGRLGSVPIHLGCSRPLLRPWASAEDVHGDGTGGLDMDLTEPDWALGFRWDIVVGGKVATPLEEPHDD